MQLLSTSKTSGDNPPAIPVDQIVRRPKLNWQGWPGTGFCSTARANGLLLKSFPFDFRTGHLDLLAFVSHLPCYSGISPPITGSMKTRTAKTTLTYLQVNNLWVLLHTTITDFQWHQYHNMCNSCYADFFIQC